MRRQLAKARLTRRELLADVAMAVGLGSFALIVTALFADSFSPEDQPVDATALSLVVVAFASLTVRRRWPMLTLSISTLATTLYLIAGYPYGLILVSFFIAVYTVASMFSLGSAALATGIALLVLLSHVFVHPSALGGWLGIIPGSAWAVVPFAIGTTVRTTREAREAARAESVRQQVYEERLRLAQEVHDIVGHGLAAIQMQADVALYVGEAQPSRTRAALESISRASSEAFEELRSTLDVFSGPSTSVNRPVSGFGEIDALVDRIRSAGIAVQMTKKGEPPHVPAAVELAVYRLLQESLTNVIRHGSRASADVALDFGEDVISIRVTNPGPVPAARPIGRGIGGMKRRVAAVGGTVDAGPANDGFEVRAEIPTGGTR